MTMRRLTLIFFATLLGAIPAFAQMEHPVLAKGFAADKLYQFGGLDSVNTFNGNLVISIPIGPKFAVNGPLSYSLNLVYNSKVWAYVKVKNDCPPDVFASDCSLLVYRAIPTRHSNVGLGWMITLGRTVPADDIFNPDPDAGFQTPDGAIHKFYDVLHPEDGHVPTLGAATSYARDNTYLRGSASGVEFPDGISETIANSKVTSIKDPYGNSVIVNEYISSADLHSRTPCFVSAGETISSADELQDSQGRKQYICFTDAPIIGSTVHEDNLDGGQSIRHVITVAPNGQSSVYTFNYELPYDPTSNTYGIARGCHSHLYSDSSVMVPLLSSIDLPDGSYFKATYNLHDTGHCEQGTLASLTLPTGGQLAYTYRFFDIPSNVCTANGTTWYSGTTGVETRNLISGGTTSTWTYSSGYSDKPTGTHLCARNDDLIYALPNPAEAMSTFIEAPDKSVEVHWYSIWPFDNVSPNGFTDEEFSLPLNHLMQNGSYLGSIERYGFNADGTTDADKYPLLRTTYVKYEHDGIPSGACGSDIDQAVNSSCYDTNRRLLAEHVVYADDLPNGVARYADTENRDFDGFGHYRETKSSGNFDGLITQRTTRTEFNPGTDASGNRNGSFAFLPGDTWFLNSYTDKCAKDGVASLGTCNGLARPYAHESFCFDGLFLKARRSERGPSLTGTVDTSKDLLVTFHNDGHGNPDQESYYGGDLNAIGGTNACDSSGSTPEYSLTHTYHYGVLETTKLVSGASSLTVLDQTIGAGGVPESSRDASGLETTYQYDTMGRLVSSSPNTSQGVLRGGWTTYKYENAGAQSNARVTIENLDQLNGNAIAHEEYEYDGLGRLTTEKVRLPDGSLSTRRTTYNAMGWKDTVSEYEASSIPTHVSSFKYDPFGRPTSIKSADQKETTIVYHGVSSQDKTLHVFMFPQSDRTQTPDELPVITTETYDRFGRLIGVAQPSLTATYGYDTGDRLTTVQLTGGGQNQNRSFLYDYSGLLLKEMHPESQPVTYTDYDSRGHAHRRTVQPKNAADTSEQRFDLKLKFDFAERMTEVHSIDATNNDLLLKQYVFGSSSTSTNWANGKLIEATRHNRQKVSPTDIRDVRVTERYVYGQRDGNISQKRTCVDTVLTANDVSPCDENSSSASKRVFSTQYEFDPDSRLSSITYPTCTGCGVPGPDRKIINQYTNGFLTAVSTPQTTLGSLSYSANTTLNTIAYAPQGVIDTITPDPNAMPRPAAIEFSGWIDPAGCLPHISGQPADVPVANNTTANLSVIATGDPLTYQWYEVDLAKNAHMIDGATAATFTTPAITGTHVYHVVVTNSCGSVTSRDATVSVSSTPSGCPIVSLPSNAHGNAGTQITLTASTTVAATDYVWFKVAADGSSQTYDPCAHLQACPVTVPAAGVTDQYWVRVPASGGCSESNSGKVAVFGDIACPTPEVLSFTDGNASTTAGMSHTLTLTLRCIDNTTTFTWTKLVLGKGNPVQFTPNTPTSTTDNPTETTTYTVNVTNSSGTTSASVTVHIQDCGTSLQIAAQPPDQWVGYRASAHLVIDAGTNAISYDWYKGTTGSPTSQSIGQTSVPYIDTPPVDTDPTFFWVRVHGSSCSVDSRTVVVNICPYIVSQPAGVIVTPTNNRAVIGVVVTGDHLQYQWYRGESGDTSNPVVNGNDPNLQINVDQTTKFWIRITGVCGPVDSRSATVEMCYPPSITQPAPYQLIVSGQSVTLTTDSTLTTAEFSWFEVFAPDDVIFPGGEYAGAGKSVTLTGLTPGIHHFRARVLTSDHHCYTDSNIAVVEVCAPPQFTSLPIEVYSTAGAPVNIGVGLDQDATVKWYATDPRLGPATVVTLPVYPTTTTTYWVQADNGKCVSDVRSVTVVVCTPVFTSVTPSQMINAGTSITLQAAASGPSMFYEWWTGTTSPTDRISRTDSVVVSPATDTNYWVKAMCNCPNNPPPAVQEVTISVCYKPQFTVTPPDTLTVAVGYVATLSAAASGTGVQIHWFKGALGDRSNPVSATSFTASDANAGTYWVEAAGACGTINKQMTLVVCHTPVLTTQPVDTQVQTGNTATLSVTATGTNLTYSWIRVNTDGTETPVGTASSYTTDAMTSPLQYYVNVLSSGYCSVRSNTVTVSVCNPPQFTTGPSTIYVNSGPVNLSAPVDDPNATLTWYASDPRLGPATVVTLPVNPTTTTTYWAKATDGICVSGVTSETVVYCTPQFTSVTPSQTITQGNSVTLSATANGPSLSYKWWTGTTTPTTQIASANSIAVTPTTDTYYWAEAQCSCPITTSPIWQQVTITVCHPAQITLAPQPTQNVTVGDWISLYVTATGTNVQVHWYKGAVGDKSTPVTVPAGGGWYATANDSGTYWVEAASTCGTTTAQTVVDVCVPPVITTQPVGTQISSGNSATLSVAATGTSLTYAWTRVNADNTETVVGSAASFNTGALTADTTYYVRVYSRNRCYVNSNRVTVAVCTVPQITYVTPSQTIGMQQPVTLYVAASGTSMQYEWKNLSTNQIIGTTTTVNVAPSATTSYQVRVYSGICSVTSATVTLTVCGPYITQQPASKTITYGTSTTLSVAALGDGTLTAQWYIGDPGSTNLPAGSGLTITVQPYVSTRYWARVSTPCRSVDSAAAQITVSGCTQPAIASQSGNMTVVADQNATMSITTSPTADMYYQWYQWDPSSSTWGAVSGATSSSYTEGPTTISNTYMASAWNSCGLSVNSASIAITRTPVCYPAAFATQPTSVTYNAGSSVTFTAAASGSNVRYQWYGADPTGGSFVALTGKTASTLTVTPTSQSASYYVTAIANCGATAVSNTVTATRACTPPAASTQTQSQTIRKNTWVTLSFTATGTAPLSYTWYSSTTGSNFTQLATGTAVSVQPQVTTYYYATASNSCGSVSSSYITITVTQCAPTISTQPASQTINSTQSVTLSVVATSDQLHYQWYISTGGSYTPINGATASTLTYSPTATSYFYVYVSNDCGSVNSNVATVTVTPVCYAPTVTLTGPSTGQFDDSGQAIITASFTGSNPTLTYYRTPPNGTNPIVVGGPGTATQVTVYYGGIYTYWYYYVVASNACGTATSRWLAIGQYNPEAQGMLPSAAAVQWAGSVSTAGWTLHPAGQSDPTPAVNEIPVVSASREE